LAAERRGVGAGEGDLDELVEPAGVAGDGVGVGELEDAGDGLDADEIAVVELEAGGRLDRAGSRARRGG
jgi:hypothetical protein